MIKFNKPYISGHELTYIEQAISSGHTAGNGSFTKKCNTFFEKTYGFKKALLTSSCTDALEMCAILANIQPGDEVIVPSYTFVSTALAFVRQGATIVFADSQTNQPNIDTDKIKSLITNKTKAIVPVHYAGVACDMDKIMSLANQYNLLVIEDAALAIDSYYKNKPLGSIGHLATFSFHETKNISSGEGGLLVINDEQFINRAEIIWEKGTNRAQFFRGEINKYGWVDTGSSFLPSDITAAYLLAQLDNIEKIQIKRKEIWANYMEGLKDFAKQLEIKLPDIPSYSTNNGNMFYMVCKDKNQRKQLINYLKENGICAVFHYQSLHQSTYYHNKYKGEALLNADRFTDCLVRLPLYADLTKDEQNKIIETCNNYHNIVSN
ncbi:MAG: dTDP-4-amino-4,6-dideoxygalactose transaminase [Vicingaceae bacterium]|nr:dTDP-4-amino-4,6-dideoxygalactose transaminase [Vicingaceae bacterium]